jgi:hypothetical protein
VVVLGDSFTEGQGVIDADTTVRRLEARLRAADGDTWEVLNCGRRGADFPSLHRMFERTLEYDPDLVVHAMVLNDAERSREFDARRHRLDDWILARRRVMAGDDAGTSALRPRLFDFVGDRITSWRVARETTRWYLDLYGPANAEGWSRTQEALRDMQRRMHERGGAFLVASWPLLVDFDRYPFSAADAEIARFCAAASIPRVDLRAAVGRRPAPELWVHPIDHHPNEVAHALAAEALVGPVRDIVTR